MKLGLEVLQQNTNLAKKMGRCALLMNQASIDQNFEPSWKILLDILGKDLVAFFSPQHGFHSTVQDNMIETDHEIHKETGIKIFSLYSESREPSYDMLKNVDTIVVDLQIVGCRVYTFKYTIAACLRAAAKYKKKVVVLDRPNPLGGEIVEGNTLNLKVKSFVGEFEIPMRHGLTPGEIALFFNSYINAELEVIKAENLNPSLLWHEHNRPWVLTSPNLTTIDSVYIYPGTVLCEATNISEGRGTGLPFQFIGAPFVSETKKLISLIKEIAGRKISSSIFLRETSFQPTSQKHKDSPCHGFQIHILEPYKIKPYAIGLSIIRAFQELYSNEFQWKKPPYEYELEKSPIDLITGIVESKNLFCQNNFNLNDTCWNSDLNNYIDRVQPFLLYGRKMHNEP